MSEPSEFGGEAAAPKVGPTELAAILKGAFDQLEAERPDISESWNSLKADIAKPGYLKRHVHEMAIVVAVCGGQKDGEKKVCRKKIAVLHGTTAGSTNNTAITVFRRNCAHHYDLRELTPQLIRQTFDKAKRGRTPHLRAPKEEIILTAGPELPLFTQHEAWAMRFEEWARLESWYSV